MKRLTKRIGSKVFMSHDNCVYKNTSLACNITTCYNVALNRLAEYEDAEEQGLLVRLPCKVGDTLYHASCAFNRVDQYTVLSISMLLSPNVSRMEINAVNHRGAVLPFDVSDFGDTIFLTREAAEKALEKV